MRRCVMAVAAALLVAGSGCASSGPEGGASRTAAPPAAVPPSASVVSRAVVPPTGLAPAVPPQRCASSALSRLTPAQRAGQVLMVGVPVGSASAAVTSVRTYHVGGVFLAGRSRSGPAWVARQVRALQAAARSSGVALHVAVDQEGGRVQTLRGPGFGTIPPADVQGRWTAEVLERRARQWAESLRSAGVTMNLAPVADTVAAADARRNPPIGAARRHYGSTPGEVSADVAAVVRGSAGAGIVPTVKHFPGLGRVRVNTDVARGATDSVASAKDPNLSPFAAGIRAGSTAVMMSSASYPRIDRARLAVFSPRAIGLLRGQLGFTGIVMSDDLGAAAAVQRVPVGQRAVRFVAAGGDLVLTVRRSDAPVMRAALTAEAARSATFRHRLDEAALHILESKVRAGLVTC